MNAVNFRPMESDELINVFDEAKGLRKNEKGTLSGKGIRKCSFFVCLVSTPPIMKSRKVE